MKNVESFCAGSLLDQIVIGLGLVRNFLLLITIESPHSYYLSVKTYGHHRVTLREGYIDSFVL